VTFFEVLGNLLQETPQLKDKIKIILAGEVDLSVQKCIEQNGLKERTTYCGMISRQEVYALYASASLLILPVNQAANAKGRIPGKLFELLRTSKPILVFGPSDGDVKQIVEQKQRGISVRYHDHQKLKNYLQKAIFEHEFENFDANSSVREFSNFELTQQVAKLLDGITA
jgi:glycosyltransferase involved in cell wall biosynthesis